MPHFYTYFISSLPALNFTDRPPLIFEKFISLCQEFIPAADAEIIKNISISRDYSACNIPVSLKKWYEFDIALRNELVKIRSGRKHLDAAEYLRPQSYFDAGLTHFALNATRNAALQEVEKNIDLQRWHFLDELSFGHYFDLDLLIIYAVKLLILERWEKIADSDRERNLREALAKF